MTQSVLIIEDETVLARNLAAALQRIHINAVVASTYAQGVRLVSTRKFDLICSDIHLGDGNGLDLAEKVNQMSPSSPVIIMTGQDSVAQRTRAESAQAIAFLAKPFALSHFRDLVISMLQEGGDVAGSESENRRGPCVMMYSHDSIGLGHMRRNNAIATELVATVPGISVLLVIGCPSGDIFNVPSGVDVIKLPSVTKVAREKWRPGSLRISAQHLLELRAGLIDRAVESFRPDVIVVDHEPVGVWGELRPMFARIANQSNQAKRPHLVLGLRDILDLPELVAKRWRESGTDALIPTTYDTVLIYGDEQVFPSAAAYGLNAMPSVRKHYCGYVSSGHKGSFHEASRESSTAKVLITGGGGRDAYPMMDAALTALEKMTEKRRPNATLVTGPLMDSELTARVQRRAESLGLNYLRTSNDIPDLIARADLFVTMGGYNSMVEAVLSGVATLVVPRLGPSAEQRIRAELFSQLGLVTTISMERDPVTQLRHHFERVRQRARPVDAQTQKISLNGARNAARIISEVLRRHAVSYSRAVLAVEPKTDKLKA